MQLNSNVKRKQRCLLFAKTQQIYSKNRSRLAKSILDGEDITKEINEMPIDLQCKYWSESISKWLRLPSDNSLCVLYAPSSVGGIAISRIFLAISVLPLKNISSIRRNDYTIIKTLPDSVILKWSTPRL